MLEKILPGFCISFWKVRKRIIFTNGFKKKTKKAPRREIETAIRYRAEYIKRINR